MRDLSQLEGKSVAEITASIGEAGFSKAIRMAASAAKKQMQRMNKNLVNGMSCEDFAVEAYIYITSKGQSLSFMSRRAQLLVIDHHRYESGRKTSKNRARYLGNSSEIATRIGRKDASKLEIPPSMDRALKRVCEGLMCGYTKKAIASRIGMHPATLSKMLQENKKSIEAMFL